MKPIIKKILCTMLFVMMTVAASVAHAGSGSQVIYAGGGESADGITVSKEIAGTEKENYFDITLKVTVQNVREELLPPERTAAVIVLDASYTMNSKAGDMSRLQAAKIAAEEFAELYCGSEELGIRELGIAAFDTNAYTVLPLSEQQDIPEVFSAIEGIETATSDSHDRFTNIEAGLTLAGNMLDTSDAMHKYVILLTDGFPTTYIKSGKESTKRIKGYDPYGSGNYKPGEDGYFYDAVEKKVCSGTSYSDTAAAKAAAAAAVLKGRGINIFSVGMDIGGQTIQAYINTGKANGISIVERDASGIYVIGDPKDTSSYKTWLGKDIGGGPSVKDAAYCDGDDLEGMRRAYELILEEIKSINKEIYADVWDVSDTMGEDIHFLWFYDKNGEPNGNSLAGADAENGENTAAYGDKIIWELRSSGYEKERDARVYELKYAVRLMNESEEFENGDRRDTNAEAFLGYRIVQDGVLSEEKRLDFPSPLVEGYLGELVFDKVDADTGEHLNGAWFSLVHGTDCDICGGEVMIDSVTASVIDGSALIERIPSGHTYMLHEDAAPEGYASGKPMKVSVHYGETMLYNEAGMPVAKVENSPIQQEPTPSPAPTPTPSPVPTPESTPTPTDDPMPTKEPVKTPAPTKEPVPTPTGSQGTLLPETGDKGAAWQTAGIVISAVILGVLATAAAAKRVRKR